MRSKRFVLLSVLAVVALAAPYSHAIPPFSRMYGTSCSTCHIDFPKLNDFGKAFKDAGFKFPKNDEDFIKIPPVMLGAPAQKELWPGKAIYPGNLPGIPQLGLRFNTFFQVYSKNRNNFTPPTAGGPFTPRTDFQPGFFSIFTAGNFGGDIAFWVDNDFDVGGQNFGPAGGLLGDGYLKFVNIGRVFKLPKDALSLRVGQFEVDLPFSQARSWNLSSWDIYTEANISPGQNVSNVFNFNAAPGQTRGVEFSGGHQYGGYHYSLAIVDQNTSGSTAASPNVSPQVGVFSDSNFKDLYGRFMYRFNLEKDTASRNDIQAAGPNGPRDHTYLNVGSYYFYGRSVQRLLGATLEGASTVVTAKEPFYRVGGNVTFNYHNLQFNGLYMYGHDYNLLPVDAQGNLIPLQNPSQAVPVGFVHGTPATFSGGFADVEWLAYPWMMVLMRYDGVNSTSDRINGLSTNPSFTRAPFNAPFNSTRNRFTPGVQFLIHANIKVDFEYQFRTNTAVIGLDFAY